MAQQMTDTLNALVSFQKALAAGTIAPDKGKIHSDILVLLDHPNQEPRLTYGLVVNQAVVATATFAAADPINGSPCFEVGCAVDAHYRSKGYGKQMVQKAFDELTNGFQPTVPHLYVEAVVSITNDHSKKLASRLFSPTPTPCTDSVSGQPALQYVRQLF